MAPEHQDDFANSQWDEEVVAKVKIGVQGMFQDWLKTFDEVALEFADEKDLWTQWVKSNFWPAAQSILKEDNAVAAAAAAGGSDPCMTPRPIRARSGPLEETPSKPQRRKVEGRFTVLSELGQQVKPLYSVYGRVLMTSQVESFFMERESSTKMFLRACHPRSQRRSHCFRQRCSAGAEGHLAIARMRGGVGARPVEFHPQKFEAR